MQVTENKVPDKVPNKSELDVLKLLSAYPGMTRNALAAATSLSEGGIKKIIARLKAAGWIKRAGSNKTGHWVVKYGIDD